MHRLYDISHRSTNNNSHRYIQHKPFVEMWPSWVQHQKMVVVIKILPCTVPVFALRNRQRGLTFLSSMSSWGIRAEFTCICATIPCIVRSPIRRGSWAHIYEISFVSENCRALAFFASCSVIIRQWAMHGSFWKSYLCDLWSNGKGGLPRIHGLRVVKTYLRFYARLEQLGHVTYAFQYSYKYDLKHLLLCDCEVSWHYSTFEVDLRWILQCEGNKLNMHELDNGIQCDQITIYITSVEEPLRIYWE